MLRAAVLALLLAAPAFADPPTTSPAVGDPSVVAVRIIPATPPTAPLPAARTAIATQQPLICRSSIETGSLIQRHKQCLTKAQWRYVDDAHEDAARKLVSDQTTKPFCDAKC